MVMTDNMIIMIAIKAFLLCNWYTYETPMYYLAYAIEVIVAYGYLEPT